MTLEYIEWDDIWFENAPDGTNTRVLLIGDSITRAFRLFFNELAKGTGIVGDQLATSKGLDNPFLATLIDYVIAQQPEYKVINILHGAHGFHIASDEYEKLYRSLIERIQDRCPEKKILVSSCIPMMDTHDLSKPAQGNNIICDRNLAAERVAREKKLCYIDLYSKIAEGSKTAPLYHGDGVHLTDPGSKIIAQEVWNAVKESLK